MLIPKVVHRIWFGPYPMPDAYKRYGESWERHGWDTVLWTEANLPLLTNQAVFDRVGDEPVNVGGGIAELGVWVQRADIAQYELVQRFGGIYVNCDVELLRPLDDLLDGVECFVTMEDDDYASSAILGATPYHPFVNTLVETIPHRVGFLKGYAMNEVTGPHLVTDILPRHRDVTVFPKELFNPWHYLSGLDEDGPWPDAYTVHHWGHVKPGLVEGVSGD